MKYDVTDPTHFQFCLDVANEDFTDGYTDELGVDIFPREELDPDFTGEGFTSKGDWTSNGAVNFTWAPAAMVKTDGGVDQQSENNFHFKGNPDDLEKELLALGLTVL